MAIVSRHQVAVALAALTSSFSAFALGDVTGIITKVRSDYDNLVYVTVDQPITGRPACATNTSYGFFFDITDNANKSILGTVLTAYSTGKQVRIRGLNYCGTGGTAGTTEMLGTIIAQ